MILIVFLVACGSSSQKTESDSAQTEPEEIDTSTSTEDPCAWNQVEPNIDPLSLVGDLLCGRDIYMSKCAICHMENGEGSNAGKQLAGSINQYSNEHLVEVIQEGWGPMPPVAINPQQISDVIVYLRENF